MPGSSATIVMPGSSVTIVMPCSSASLLLVAAFCVVVGARATPTTTPPTDYWQRRAELLDEERRFALGGDLHLGPDERVANEIVKAAKWKEYDDGFENSEKFLPSQNFMKVRSEIEESEVFRLIRAMPKGAVLHSHDTAIVSEDWVYANVTFREDLYVCDDNGTIRLQFRMRPSHDVDRNDRMRFGRRSGRDDKDDEDDEDRNDRVWFGRRSGHDDEDDEDRNGRVWFGRRSGRDDEDDEDKNGWVRFERRSGRDDEDDEDDEDTNGRLRFGGRSGRNYNDDNRRRQYPRHSDPDDDDDHNYDNRRVQFQRRSSGANADDDEDDCAWKLLSKLRKDPIVAAALNARIRRQLSMIVEDPDRAYPTVDKAWEKLNSAFGFVTPMLTYRPVYEDHFYRGLQELREDNVLYLELRTTLPPLYELDGTVYGPVEVVEIYRKVVERFLRNYPDFVGVKLIYAPSRRVDERTVEEYLRTAKSLRTKYPNFVVGFDLVGQEDKGRTLATFVDELRRADPDVNFFFHAGETDWYGTGTDENLVDAVLLNTKRTGHGYALTKHPMIQNIVKRNNIAIEINPISNQVLGLVKDLRNHPGNALLAQDFPVVISNDDPGMWGARGLSYDFYEAFMGLMSRDADLRALKRLAVNSIAHSAMNATEMSRAYGLWKDRWRAFIDELIRARTVVAIA